MRLASFLVTFFLALSSLYAFAAQERLYFTVWQKDTEASHITPPLLWPDFVKRGETLTKRGLRLYDVATFKSPHGRRYVGVWMRDSGSNLVVKPLNRADFKQRRARMKSKGLRLVDFEVFQVPNSKPMFLGVWANGTGAEVVNGPLPFAKFVTAGNTLINRGLRLDDVEVIGSGPHRLYFGLWHPGHGSNLIEGPLRSINFGKKVKELTAKGFRLEDVEVLREGRSTFYVSVWKDGPADNRLRNLLTFPELRAFNSDMVKDGFRLTDLETFIAGVPDKTGTPPPGGGSHPGGGDSSFKVPDHIGFDNALRLTVDFSTAIHDPPRITMPNPNNFKFASLYPDLPTDHEGNVIFPDNFCGIRIIRPDRFVFNKNGAEFDSFPFNNIPECCSLRPVSPSMNNCSTDPQNCTVIPKSCSGNPDDSCSVKKVFGETIYREGIQFSGPIGQCQSSNTGWQFFSPFTRTNPEAPAEQQVTLIIELEPDSKIEFFNAKLLNSAEALASFELFTEETEKKFMEAEKRLKEMFDEGWCGIDGFIRKQCEDTTDEHDPFNYCAELKVVLEPQSPCD
jgi:hypothetical protein